MQNHPKPISDAIKRRVSLGLNADYWKVDLQGRSLSAHSRNAISDADIDAFVMNHLVGSQPTKAAPL